MNKIKHMAHGEKPGSVIKKGSTIISNQGGLSGVEKPFDAMNSIVANLLLNITRYKNTLLCCFVILVKHHSSILVFKYSSAQSLHWMATCYTTQSYFTKFFLTDFLNFC